ncbi:unnamed protein product [Angiostrongylus costaricensis]|uniref:Bis(5'-adenosyl)-triphosphatase n=1 Tax=Angiostrongylus costaricensis TaxID=334426 RepID=A0A158PJZ5_ANGCS|nr:unnamed protein product [Angiostrongylus costaricensis]
MPSCSLMCLLAILHLVASINEHPKLLLISFDGFRYDALNKTLVPNIYAFAREGAWYVNGVKPQFVTFTSTNHMAMATAISETFVISGLHAESHGIVSNVFYNTTSHLLADGSRRSACLYWPLGDASYPNTKKPTFFKYRTTDEWNRDVDTIVEWFTTKEYPMNFVAWYIGEPDHTLHESGLYNGSFVAVLKKLDDLFGYFVRQFRLHNLYSEVNVILTADHGHAQIDGVNNIMCVGDYIDLSKVVYGEQMIYLRDKSIFHEVYQNLTNAIERNSFKVKIYSKETLPSRFHYMGMPSLIGDIILSPDVGAEVRFDCKRDIYNRQKLNAKWVKVASAVRKSFNHQMARETLRMRGLAMGQRLVPNLAVALCLR